jgi:phospholipid/cholesterol/gamma-HCH transport system substrate-binding protein
MKTEAKVGLFITLSLFFLLALLSQLNSFDTLFKKSYPIIAEIEDGSGLKEKAKVKLKGVDIGYVEKVTLSNNKVQTHLMIDEGVKIPSDSVITIEQDSLLGGKFLAINPGKSNQTLKPNQLLSKEEKVSSIADASTSADETFQEIKLLVQDIRNMLDSGAKRDIQESLANINQFSELLASISKEDNQTIHNILKNANSTLLSTKEMMNNANKAMLNVNTTITDFSKMSQEITGTSKEFKRTALNINQDLPQIMARINEITQYLKSVTATLDAKLPTAMDKFVTLEENLNRVASTLDAKLPTAMNKFVRLEDNLNRTIENKDSSLNKALTSVDGFFANGTETMDKIDKYLDAAIKSELHVEMRADEVYDDGGYSKTHLNLALKPDPTRYYMLGLTSKPSFEANSKFARGYAGNKLHESGDFLFSAQYGKRYDNLLFRVGIIENQGGFGVDYFALNDTLKFSAEVNDFNAVNDVRGTNPNLTATIRYQFFKHINAYIAGNNLLNSRANSVSVGMGVSFVDNDLKNLLGVAASAKSGR